MNAAQRAALSDLFTERAGYPICSFCMHPFSCSIQRTPCPYRFLTTCPFCPQLGRGGTDG